MAGPILTSPVSPALTRARRLFADGCNVVPLVRELPADTLTPVLAWQAITAGGAPAALLESVTGGERLARYSYITGRPFAELAVRGQRLEETRDGRVTVFDGPPLPAVQRAMARYRTAPPEPGMPAFTGGAIGYMGYECARFVEPALGLRTVEAADGADLRLMLVGNVVAFDHVRQRLLLIANAIDDGCGVEPALGRAADALDGMAACLNGPAPPAATRTRVVRLAEPTASLSPEAYMAGVERLQHHIREGDIFQAVLANRFELPVDASPFAVYRALRAINPSPYLFCIDFGDQAIVGASPEMLVRIEHGEVETHPIAGTRPRGDTPDADAALADDLLADEKERAEHVMLVDLGRNDVGRVAWPGTVRVPQFMTVERYSHVMHIVSRVTGRLRADATAWDALAACFPAGTVSGAPKIRAMQLLAELEPVARGAYSGAVLHAGFDGRLDSAITIRSVAMRRTAGGTVARVQAGAGIVADSDPAREYAEVLHKCRAVLEALRRATEVDA